MRHSVLFGLLAPALLCAQQTAPAPQTTKTAKIEELFRLTKVEDMQKQMLGAMTAMMRQQSGDSSGASEKMLDFIMRKMSWAEMKADYIKLYDDTYTEDEISGILLFYQSAPGQAYLTKSPTLMAGSMALVQKRMAEIKPEMEKMIMDMAPAK